MSTEEQKPVATPETKEETSSLPKPPTANIFSMFGGKKEEKKEDKKEEDKEESTKEDKKEE